MGKGLPVQECVLTIQPRYGIFTRWISWSVSAVLRSWQVSGMDGISMFPMIAWYEVNMAVLDGELAVPCNPQTAIAGFNSWTRFIYSVVETYYRMLRARNRATDSLWTPSGSEDSSGRNSVLCAAGELGLSLIICESLVYWVKNGCTAVWMDI